jgi:hypothetical protein
MLKDYFAQDFYFEGDVRKSLLIPQEQKPTFIQFKYWFQKEQDIKRFTSHAVEHASTHSKVGHF